MRRFLSIVGAVAAAAVLAVGGNVTSSHAAQAHRPVIFVHGLSGLAPTIWRPMVADLKAHGWTDDELDVWQYDWTQSNITTAQQLTVEVDRVRASTGAAQVDVVAHSMGSLSSRYYLKVLGGTANVVHWVSIGGVNHGTVAGFTCPWASCADMHAGSAMLNALNSGDETPGDVRYETQSSICDEIAIPHSTVPLDGARNINVGCLEHISMPRNESVINATRDFLSS